VFAVDVALTVDDTIGRGRARAVVEDGLDAIAASLTTLCADDRVQQALAQPAAARPAAWRDTWRALEAEAQPGAGLLALGALDEAVWDLDRAACPPVAVDGVHPTVGVYWSGLWLHSSIDELVAETRWAAAEGFDGAKLRVDGHAVGPSVDRIRATLAAAPPGRWLALELAGSGTPDTVTEVVAAVDTGRLLWIEDPLPAGEVRATAALVRALAVPVALGEDCWGRAALAERVRATAAPLPIIDLGFCGGPTAMALVLEDGLAGRAGLGVHIDAVLGADVVARTAARAHVWLEAFAWWGAPSPADVRAAASGR
jgi:L-alanine-DL-glutamate epimerase-like enolase superfamily enzyme